MSNYNQENSFNFTPASILGGFLVILGAGVMLWVVVMLFQLFTDTSIFLILDKIIPQKMVISETSNWIILLPREIVIFGIPIWALTAASKIGLTLLKNGLDYVEKPRK